MPLQVPSIRYTSKARQLMSLVRDFNSAPTEDHLQRIFYLQRINYLLNTIPLYEELFEWLTLSGEDSWLANLNSYGINPNSSFFVKGMQFASVISAKTKETTESLIDDTKDIYKLMQERDALLKNQSFEECKDRYIAIQCQLHALGNSIPRIKELLQKHTAILAMANAKFDFIKGKESSSQAAPRPSYKTKVLGDKQVNNFNFIFEMGGWDDPFVFRVEDRAELGLEQELHSFEVSKYFIEDFAVFMHKFIGEEEPIEYKPVVLSQFANQGNLSDVAEKLRGKRNKDIGPIAAQYFTQLGDFCVKLMEAKTYHPDMKLSNFLVHNNLIRISDRKTFTREENAFGNKIRCSPTYAPYEFLNCLNEEQTGYAQVASETQLNMPQFMAFQLGLALKEFLILTQRDSVSEEEFRNPARSAESYFKSPTPLITNLSLLIQELTRTDPAKRLSIQNFNELLVLRNQPREKFYELLEELHPSSKLGIQDDLDIITYLVNSDITGEELLSHANIIFNKLSESTIRETRLTRMAEKLAAKCYRECTESFISNLAESIKMALEIHDWDAAPWYRKVLHSISFGYYRVDRVTEMSQITNTMGIDLQSESFQTYFPHLMFLPRAELNSLGTTNAQYIADFVSDNLETILSDNSNNDTDSNNSTSAPSSTTVINKALKDAENKKTEDKPEEPAKSEKKKKKPSPSSTTVIHEKDEGKKTEDKPEEPAKSEKKKKPSPSSTTVIHEKDEGKKAEDKPEEPAKPKKKKKPSPSSTTVIHEKDEGKKTEDKPEEPAKSEKKKKPSPSSTTVIHEKDEGKKTENKPEEVKDSKNQGISSEKKDAKAESVDVEKRNKLINAATKKPANIRISTIRTTLLMGDGSNSKSYPKTRTNIKDVSFEPPTTDEPRTTGLNIR